MKTTLRPIQRAFTMVELMLTVALAGSVATVGVVAYSKVNTSVKEQKLKNDQATLNGSVNVYRGFGGKMTGIDDPEVVLLKLKRAALASEAKTIPGLSGSMLDARVTPKWQTAEEAASDKPRLYWNAETMLFDLATSGPIGISQLVLNENASYDPGNESREVAFFNYSSESGWIWDFDNETRQSWVSPTVVQVEPEAVALAPEGSDLDDPDFIPDPGSAPLTLIAPEISHVTGAYSIREYALPVQLTNPNPEDTSKVYYSVDYGDWTPYVGRLSLAPEATIQTMAVAKEVSEYNNSSMMTADYSATPVSLNPPAIQTTSDIFGVFTDHEITVTIDDPNISDPSIVEYRIDEGDWQEYSTPFMVTRQGYPAGLEVDARTISTDGTYSEYYTDSQIVNKPIGVDAFTLSAASDGDFHNPYGSDQLLTNINGDQRKPKVMWGNQFNDEGIKMPGRAQSWLEFAGSQSAAVVGERVELGTLDFYNGTHGSGSGADGVALDLAMNLTISGMPIDLDLHFDFILNNVPNNSNAGSSDYDLAMASADYVELAESSIVTGLEAYGFYYHFVLEFGDSDGNGFSTFNEFHVLETESASTKLYGTFMAVPASEYNASAPSGDSNDGGKGGKGGKG